MLSVEIVRCLFSFKKDMPQLFLPTYLIWPVAIANGEIIRIEDVVGLVAATTICELFIR